VVVRGLSSDSVAEIVGNAPATIDKHSAHLDQRRQAMIGAARRAVS
jgi:hypothetical protein